ncbi:hypothetical protein [Paludibaculum fermentans]|uniref:Uncharacterized protein n=1 Tax=Paludibaculum fermentans TaxID=1473598 RepID=A0A7S7SN96_PALFE|nr:hypothetical protein [Paludibaculum fermentans]QOY90728.1 hypothetical protein IRI77_12515 [Paludibaculum fermentans]
MKARILTALCGSIVAILVLVGGWKLMWFRAFSTEVTVNGRPASTARVFRHHGEVMITFSGDLRDMYLVRPAERTVGVPSGGFWAITALFVLAKDSLVPIVDMRSAKNDSKDPRIELAKRSITFVDNESRVIQTTW